jgi:hypothetical protein
VMTPDFRCGNDLAGTEPVRAGEHPSS